MSATLGRPALGTPARPLYFLHVPKTAGSTITRVLEDAFPAGTMWPVRETEALERVSPQELAAYGVFSGHHGIRLPDVLEGSPAVVTVLRDPVERLWSLYRMHRFSLCASAGRDYPFTEFLATHDSWGHISNGQARWLTESPRVKHMYEECPTEYVYRFPSGPGGEDDERLAADARSRLASLSLVGTTPRLEEFVTALARLLGRWLPPPPLVHVGLGDSTAPDAVRRPLLARNHVDRQLVAMADELLDRALSLLPGLPAEPLVEVPWSVTMDQAFAGTGWHARVRTEDAGWHRWSGPGELSTIRLPVRFDGPMRLELDLVSAVDDDVVRSLGVTVQGRRVHHVLAPRPLGCGVVCDVCLDPRDPVEIELRVPFARRMLEPDGRLADPAALALGTIRVLAPAA
jgi:hypothetical protein